MGGYILKKSTFCDKNRKKQGVTSKKVMFFY
jgi:hypothetical protein